MLYWANCMFCVHMEGQSTQKWQQNKEKKGNKRTKPKEFTLQGVKLISKTEKSNRRNQLPVFLIMQNRFLLIQKMAQTQLMHLVYYNCNNHRIHTVDICTAVARCVWGLSQPSWMSCWLGFQGSSLSCWSWANQTVTHTTPISLIPAELQTPPPCLWPTTSQGLNSLLCILDWNIYSDKLWFPCWQVCVAKCVRVLLTCWVRDREVQQETVTTQADVSLRNRAGECSPDPVCTQNRTDNVRWVLPLKFENEVCPWNTWRVKSLCPVRF